MSVNKYQSHVLVLPEDDANRQLANGFLLDQYLSTRKIQVLEEVGGWIQVLERFLSDYVAGMDLYQSRFMVLLIDSMVGKRGYKMRRRGFPRIWPIGSLFSAP